MKATFKSLFLLSLKFSSPEDSLITSSKQNYKITIVSIFNVTELHFYFCLLKLLVEQSVLPMEMGKMRISRIKEEFHGNFTAWQAEGKGEAQSTAVFSADVETSRAARQGKTPAIKRFIRCHLVSKRSQRVKYACSCIHDEAD